MKKLLLLIPLLALTLGCEPHRHTRTEFQLATNAAYLRGRQDAESVLRPEVVAKLMQAMILSQRTVSTNQVLLSEAQREILELLRRTHPEIGEPPVLDLRSLSENEPDADLENLDE